ncbi:hypothetical protein [Kitasatospora sp. NPDC017646]
MDPAAEQAESAEVVAAAAQLPDGVIHREGSLRSDLAGALGSSALR